MAEHFFNGMLVCIIWFGFGIWGIRKLLNQNPRVKDAATSGVVGLIKRLLR